ncbi:4'-phosphopantetheinyl transferase family protein [Streptomyces sp. NPDC002851]
MAAEVLDPAELRRAAAFQDPRARDRYVTAHVGLRVLLGRHVGAAPARLSFTRERCGMPGCAELHGRPALVGHPGVRFSLSHAADAALYALAATPVGVDVEAREVAASVVDGAGRMSRWLAHLHRDERRTLAALPAGQRRDAFLSCWVRKEAYFKGIGTGLAAGLGSQYVGFAETYAAAAADAPAGPEGWSLVDLPVPGGYRAAVAVRTGDGPAAERAAPTFRLLSLRRQAGGDAW